MARRQRTQKRGDEGGPEHARHDPLNHSEHGPGFGFATSARYASITFVGRQGRTAGLPAGLEYRFLGPNLILHDTKANLILDTMSRAVTCAGGF